VRKRLGSTPTHVLKPDSAAIDAGVNHCPATAQRGDALAWIELYPDFASSESVVSLDGEKVTYPEMDLDALLSVLDEPERLYRTT
jgi:hypothetical protein